VTGSPGYTGVETLTIDATICANYFGVTNPTNADVKSSIEKSI